MKQIIAMGGGGCLMEDSPLLDDFILSSAKGTASRVCFIATASGDSDRMLVNFYTALGTRCRVAHLPLFRRVHTDIASFLLEQDVIYVGGGNTANMLAVWRVHGVDEVLSRAYESGIVLCGLSAGAQCWFEASVTDSFGGPLAPLSDGLGLLSGSFCPHYDGDPKRRSTYESFVTRGLQPGFAADDGAALHFVDGALSEIVTSRPQAAGYKVEDHGGQAYEERLPTRYLGHAR
jgi:peptidase E